MGVRAWRRMSRNGIRRHNAKVTLPAVPSGYGMVSGVLVGKIPHDGHRCCLLGEGWGNRNPYSIVRATFRVLKEHERIKDTSA